jgi:hypothetical protein
VVGRIDAIGSSVVMPEGAPANPASIERCTGTTSTSEHELRDVHLDYLLAFRILAEACLSSRAVFVARALRPRDVILAHTGLRSQRQFGKSREFDNVRHYLPGDNSEDIHWKATAIADLWRSCRARARRDSFGCAGGLDLQKVCRASRSKAVLMPIRELMTSPSEKSRGGTDEAGPIERPQATFSVELTIHMASGITWGFRHRASCFSNHGVILGAVAADYARTG